MKSSRIIVVAIVIAMICLGIAFVSTREGIQTEYTKECRDFGYGWTYESSISRGNIYDLPIKVEKIGGDKRITLYNTLPKDVGLDNPYLCFYTTNQEVTVKVEGKLCYTHTSIQDMNYGNMWHLIKLPENVKGKSVEITFIAQDKRNIGNVSEIYYGSKSGLFQKMLLSRYIPISICFITAFLCVVLWITTFAIFRKKKTLPSLAYLGMLSFCVFCVSIDDTQMAFFRYGTPEFYGILRNLAIYIIPFFFIGYIEQAFSFTRKRVIKGLILLSTLNFIANFIILLTVRLSDQSHIEWLNLMIIMGLIGVIVMITEEVFFFNNKRYVPILLNFVMLLMFSSISLKNLYSKNYQGNQYMSNIGVIVFLVTMTCISIRDMIKKLADTSEIEILEEIAYRDGLTNAYNRSAFTRDISEKNMLLAENVKNNLGIMVIDINDLKLTNDRKGHLVGDKMIIATATLIEFYLKKIGTNYRIGGDEFAIIIEDTTREEFWNSLNKFTKKLDEFNKLRWETPLSFSIGYSFFSKELDLNLFDTFQRADKMMYRNKKVGKDSVVMELER